MSADQTESNKSADKGFGPAAQPPIKQQRTLILAFGTKEQEPPIDDATTSAWIQSLLDLAKIGELGRDYGNPWCGRSAAIGGRYACILVWMSDSERIPEEQDFYFRNVRTILYSWGRYVLRDTYNDNASVFYCLKNEPPDVKGIANGLPHSP